METDVVKTNGKASRKDAIVKSSILKIPEKRNGVVKPVEKVEIPIEEKKPVVLSLEQKIEKIENLKTLIEKREKLEASRKKLSSFVVGTNQFNENLVLTDENGNSFQTSNSEVVTKVIAAINETLVKKISETEKQIEF